MNFTYIPLGLVKSKLHLVGGDHMCGLVRNDFKNHCCSCSSDKIHKDNGHPRAHTSHPVIW